MSFTESTAAYLAWLRDRIKPDAALFQEQIDEKNKKMAAGAFPFLRGTFYRWAELWLEHCPDLAAEPKDAVLAIGDLHMENFGTWRDAQGRLVWGVNDFDEAHEMAFTSDLVRLVTSALAAAKDEDVQLTRTEAADAVLKGYRKGCEGGGGPFILDTTHDALRKLVDHALADEDVTKFWDKLKKEKNFPLSTAKRPVPPEVQQLLKNSFPGGTEEIEFRVVVKPKGLGSLGRPRFLALGTWQGGLVGREAKRLAPSAVERLADPASNRIMAGDLANSVTLWRSPDPTYRVLGDWVVRGLSPDAVKVELGELDPLVEKRQAILDLLKPMGRETANIHLGSKKAEELLASLDRLTDAEPAWLADAAKAMWKATQKDQEKPGG